MYSMMIKITVDETENIELSFYTGSCYHTLVALSSNRSSEKQGMPPLLLLLYLLTKPG